MTPRRHQSGTWFLLISICGLIIWTVVVARQRIVLLERPSSGPAAPQLPDMRIDINSASEAELAALPAIGPGLAARIVADRQQRGGFDSVDSLARVSGIGKAVLDRVRPFVVARHAATEAGP